MTRSHQRGKLLKLGFHRRTPQFPRLSLSHQFPTPEIGKRFFGRDGGHSPLYYRRAGYVPRAPARFDPHVARDHVISLVAAGHVPYYNQIGKEDGQNVMSTDATLTSKGQTTIPKQIRDSLRMKAGDRMTFTLMPDGLVLMRVKSRSVMSVAGRLRKKGRKPVPVEQLSR